MEIFFLLKETNEEPIEAGVEIPVEEAQVVPLYVVLVINEFDRLTFLFALTFSFHEAEEDFARDEFELFELVQELRFKEGGLDGGVGHGVYRICLALAVSLAAASRRREGYCGR